MRSILSVFLFSYFFASYDAKVFSNCELAKELKNHGMDNYYGYSLANWVCMANHESNYDTSKCNTKNSDGTIDYGIFQVNNKWWCTDKKIPSKNGCNIACNKLLDDNINDDIACIKRIVKDPNRMDAWKAWVKHCKGKNLSNYLAGCKL